MGAVLNLMQIILGAKSVVSGLSGLSESNREIPTTARQVGEAPVETGQSRRGARTAQAGGVKVKRGTVRTIDERVAEIVRLVRKGKRDPKVQKFVGQVLNRKCGSGWCIPEKDWRAEFDAIYRAVRERIRYTYDPRGVDAFRAPGRTLEWGFGDCDDFSAVIAACLEAAGYKTRLRVLALKPNGPRQYSHIIALVQPPRSDKWIAMDASVDKKPGWYPKERVSGFKDFDIPV